MSGATDHLPRLLALVPWLLANPGTPVGTVAREFGVDEKQVRADLDLLWMCGLPGYGPGDLMDVVYEDDRVSLYNAETIARPLRLAADEALALVAALRALLGVPGLVETGAVDSALAKLESAAGAAVGDEVAAVVDQEGDPGVVSAVASALEAGRQIELRYWVPARDETTDRVVDPIRVFTAEGRAYLVGWCHRVADVRTFRLDRALSVTLLDTPAEVPEEVRRRALDAGLFRPSDDDRVVTLGLDPAARWVADYHPCESVEEAPGGGLVVRIRARDDAWIRRLALGLAGHVRVLDPPEVADDVRAAAADALAGYPATS